MLGIADWVADYGTQYLKSFGFTSSRPPSQATWYRVLGAIDFTELETRMYAWARQVLWVLADQSELPGIAIDGKTLRGSKKQGAADAHLLSAVRHQLAVTLMQVAVDDKSNEIPTAGELLAYLEVKGQVFTMDALLTQRDLAQTILDRQGHYLFVVKDNQPHLRQDIELLFTEPPPRSKQDLWPAATTTDTAHGRIETRWLQATTALNDYLDWPGVQQVFQLVRKRTDKRRGVSSIATTYGITSLSPSQATAAQLLSRVRQHWTIENRVHWIRDVVFDEDHAQTRQGHLPHVCATLRNVVLTLLRAKGVSSTARARRRFAARPAEALLLVGLQP